MPQRKPTATKAKALDKLFSSPAWKTHIKALCQKQKQLTKSWEKECKEHTPKFKVGDKVEFTLSGGLTVVYEVVGITEDKWGKVYGLMGLKILADPCGKAQNSSEFRRYDPYCAYFDETAQPWPANSVKFIKGE